MSKPVIEATPNGPYVVSSPPSLKNSKGEELETKPVTALCRCGRSSNKPFCDGTHAKVGFDSSRQTDGSADKQDHYKGGAITINDNRSVCAHAARCTDGLKSVFKYGEEPWIDPNGASAEEIRKTAENCPSGALSYTIDDVEHADFGREPSIYIAKNGPYAVAGGVELKDSLGGQTPQSSEHYTLCRCGGSKLRWNPLERFQRRQELDDNSGRTSVLRCLDAKMGSCHPPDVARRRFSMQSPGASPQS